MENSGIKKTEINFIPSLKTTKIFEMSKVTMKTAKAKILLSTHTCIFSKKFCMKDEKLANNFIIKM